MTFRRTPRVQDAFDYQTIRGVIAWNDPDHDHSRWQLHKELDECINDAVIELANSNKDDSE